MDQMPELRPFLLGDAYPKDAYREELKERLAAVTNHDERLRVELTVRRPRGLR